jgi:hypothetical protein
MTLPLLLHNILLLINLAETIVLTANYISELRES